MTTSGALTIDHINQFFSLDAKLEQVELPPTATGGMGIDNIEEFPPPKPYIREKKGTDYCQHFIEKEKEQEEELRQTLDLPCGSTVSINTMEDVEDGESIACDDPGINQSQTEAARRIYHSYYNTSVNYNTDLPITHYRERILNNLNLNPVLVIQGSTGCGKTTQVPQYILDHHAMNSRHCNIIVTQPRKIAAISVARRVCQERNWQLGTIVGYQVAMDNKTSDDTRISYVTTGVLLQKLVNSKRMNMYTHVIIDEVHERDQDTDFAILVVKKLLLHNSRSVKVILMSATFDTKIFSNYFTLYGEPAPVIEVSGKSKEVTEHYLQELSALHQKLPEIDPDIPMVHESLYGVVLKLMFVFDKIEKSEQGVPPEENYAPSRGAVLIFLPGYEEINSMANKLQEAAISRKFWILPLHSTITVEEQQRVFRSPPADHRKVIISTNIAESSITVPDVKYVIDFCLTKSLVFDNETNYTCLKLEWASKANCTQRKGRAGRVDIGRVYRMVTRQFYEDFLPEYGIPEMQRCPLTQTVLAAKKLDFGEPQALLALAMEPPALSDIEMAILELKEVLALTVSGGESIYDGELTFIGRVMASLPLDVKVSKLIILGYAFGVLEDCIIIAASLSLKSFVAKPFGKLLDVYKSSLAWADNTYSDCFSYLHAYKTWWRHYAHGRFRMAGGVTEKQWCDNHFIQMKRIKEVEMLVRELKNRLEAVNIMMDRQSCCNENDQMILMMAIAGAFFPYYYFQEGLDEQDAIRQINGNDLYSTVVVSGFPANQGILYACALRDMMACCGSRMNIDFEERKAYVQFDRSQLEAHKVHPSVYLAVKMRQLSMPLDLPVFSFDDAANKMEQLRILKNAEWKTSKKLPSARFSVRRKLKRVPLPPRNTHYMTILITNVINCGYFWARKVDPHTDNVLKFIDTSINMNLGKNLKPLTKLPDLDALLLAPFKETADSPEFYYRAQVQNIEGKKVKAFFVDYGNTEDVLLEDLREIHADAIDVLTTPALAQEFYLSEVRPYSRLVSEWSSEATIDFKNMVRGKTLSAMIYSTVQDTIRVELSRMKQDGTFESINKLLIKKGYAELAEESYLSKQDHEKRIAASSYQASYNGDDASATYEFSPEDTQAFNELRKTNRTIRLHGPSSALEVSYKGMTRLDSTKVIKVDRNSVNSVSLNCEPQDTNTRMMVASFVTVSPSSDVLRTSSTTLLPKIRGLASLICLLFAPAVELRSDKNRRSYTGAICGLGFNPSTGEALYPDHDIELTFDTEIDFADLEVINSFRIGMNLLLGNKSDLVEWDRGGIKKIQADFRKFITNDLFKKKRATKTPEYFNRSYMWQQVPPEYVMQPVSVESYVSCSELFAAIKGISLCGESSLQSELKAHICKLYDMAGDDTDPQIITCRLCSETSNSPKELKLHLKRQKHIRKEKELFKNTS